MKKLVVFFILISVFVTLSYEAQAIPAFARQYKLSCQTCHAPAPRLKPYGDEFAGNGFRFKDSEAPRYFLETGDENLSLMREFPFGMRLDLNATYNNANKKQGDFGTPYVLKILSGGTIAKDVAYYFYFFFSERGKVAGIEDAYIMFNDLFNIDLDLYVGQFQVSDPLFKRELRLTFDDYEIYRTKIGLSKTNLTYDRGLMITLGLETGTDFMFEILNGNGIGEADELRLFDDDKFKNYFARVSQEISEWFRIGAFGYIGKTKIGNPSLSVNSEFNMYGPDLTLSYEDKAELNLQYLFREDKNMIKNTTTSVPNDKVKTQGGFAELIITPDGDKVGPYGALLLNYIDSDYKELNKKSIAVHLGHAIRRNLRFFVEYSYNDTEELGKFGRGIVGIMAGF